MIKRVSIGVAWWLAVAYFWQFGAALWGFQVGLGPFVALAVAWLVAGDPVGVWVRARRPAASQDAERPVRPARPVISPNA